MVFACAVKATLDILGTRFEVKETANLPMPSQTVPRQLEEVAAAPRRIATCLKWSHGSKGPKIKCGILVKSYKPCSTDHFDFCETLF